MIAGRGALRACALVAGLALCACGDPPEPGPSPSASVAVAPPVASSSAPPVAPPPPPEPTCPPDMVLVRRAYCVDRYEAALEDRPTKTPLSPYYPPERGKAAYLLKMWTEKRGTGTDVEQKMPLPPFPAWQAQRQAEIVAVSREGVVPQGYATGKDAAVACKNAGKRLCTRDEWRTACRGEEDRDFPYGATYEQGTCNIFREAHPAIVLWDDPSVNHTDPRLNQVSVKGKPLLRRTGGTPACVSRWGGDAIHDMVGNLDEWIDDPDGTFLGGFYGRSKKDGCQSAVSAHGITYADYSTGIRCCRDVEMVTPRPTAPTSE